jgi:hypothetical protein
MRGVLVTIRGLGLESLWAGRHTVLYVEVRATIKFSTSMLRSRIN